MELLSTVELEQIVRERIGEAQVEQYQELRERRADVISEAEQQTLTAMAHAANLRTLPKA